METKHGQETDRLGFVYIKAAGRPAVRIHEFIREALKQDVRIIEGTYTYNRWSRRLTALNLMFEGPASAIDSLGQALEPDTRDEIRL